MGFLRRKRQPIAEFWAWWAESGASATAAALADREPRRVVGELSRHVKTVTAGLAWELAAGRTSEHTLIVTADGDPDLRAAARRWRMAAPAADATWAYSDFRLPAPNPADMALELGGHRVDVAAVVAATEVTETAIHVRLHHPSFTEMPDDARTRAAYLLLDAALGEAAVEMWIGEIAVAEAAPPDAVPLAALPAMVDELAARNTTEDGEPSWALLHGEGADGVPVMASVQVPLSSASAPHLDTHVAVVVPFTDRNEGGFPGPASLQPLRDLEDHLRERLGGSGRVVAHETRDGRRVLHAYVDGTTPAADQLRVAVQGWQQGHVETHPQPDPGWKAVAHLRV